MNKETMINEYLDGSLNTEAETTMFQELAEDQTLRMDFKQQLQLNHAIAGDIAAFTPTVETTMGIFDKLGFQAGAAALQLPAKVGFFAKHAKTIYSSIATSIVAVGITLALLQPWGNSNNNSGDNLNIANNNANIPVVASTMLADSSINANDVKETNALDEKINEKIVYKYVYINKDNNNISETSEPEVKTIVRFVEPISSSNAYSNDNFGNLLSLSDNTQLQNHATSINHFAGHKPTHSYFANTPESEFKRISLEITGNSNVNINGGSQHPAEYQAINNTGVALFYNPNSQIAVGVEYSRENFYQSFTGTELSKTYHYEQQPNFQFLAANFRWKPNFARLGFVQAYYEFSTGIPINYSRAGYLLRPVIIGAEISPFDSFSFLIASDYSMLFYSHQETMYSSKKYGFNIGLQWNF